MFGSLLERPLVAADALDRYPLLVSMFDKELDCCKLLYNQHVRSAEEMGESHNNACAVCAGCQFMDPKPEKSTFRLLWLGMKRRLVMFRLRLEITVFIKPNIFSHMLLVPSCFADSFDFVCQ